MYPGSLRGTWVPVSQRSPTTRRVPTCQRAAGSPVNPGSMKTTPFIAPPTTSSLGTTSDCSQPVHRHRRLCVRPRAGRRVGPCGQTSCRSHHRGEEAQLQVDCMAGVWTAALTRPVEDNPMRLFLLGGDLEEGIAGFLALSGTPASKARLRLSVGSRRSRTGSSTGSPCGVLP